MTGWGAVTIWLPPLTKPLVAMAEVERPVMVVTATAIRTITHERAEGDRKNHIMKIVYFNKSKAK